MKNQMTSKWDIRFLELVKLVSSWSRDPSTKTGAAIVRPNNTIASLGFNGFPMQMPDKPEWYEDREEKYSRIIHCEMNALLTSRERVNGYTLYTYPFASCDRCAVHLIQAGIKKFVFPKLPPDKIERWGASMSRSIQYFQECGIVWREL